MLVRNYTRFHGTVSKSRYYALVIQQDTLYIVPVAGMASRQYDPFEDNEGLLLDVVRAGAAVADCDAFMDYCLSQKILPLKDAAFWRCGDFFVTRSKQAQPLIDILLAFARRYGLPAWEQNGIVAAYPARYQQRVMALRQNDGDNTNYLLRYKIIQPTGAVPACTLALTLLNFYLQFVEGTDVGDFHVRNAGWSLKYEHKKTPELVAQVSDLTTCINLIYAQLVSGEGRAVRQCKHCRKFFIAGDLRAEYCSPRCRGAYNSKMTRKRVKERKLREGE